MDDPALEAIRQKRMEELMGSGGSGGGNSVEAQQEQQERKRAMEDQRSSMLAQVLLPAARERLSRISIVKPEKARQVENMILGRAQRGQIGERVGEDQLIKFLEQMNEETSETKTKVTVNRRRDIMNDDDW
eukprot:CAMPEP_0196584992 /NCGR_PEP_ID=MMETSP1081-20130531/49272_1 /TAXON_ID=36882 /ORGANISM="Pyramimonas amylifera, Strain CCMP720" /LENGTH=130 /DNA_ID=CAMNT_0041906397 /DNA_START=73 /DNA_END=465 /DNA_ORIENTATION=+